LLKSIVGLEIRLTRLIGKAKLSQNKPEADLRSAAAALLAHGEQTLGTRMLLLADRLVAGD
jgi:transcriptional regulator